MRLKTEKTFYSYMMKRRAVVFALSVIIIRFLWSSLDANPLLFIYDAYLTQVSTISTPDTRRIFHSDTTSLEGKTVWITGSSSGIGAELAVQLSSAGVGHLILSGRRVEKLESTAKSCREAQMMRSAEQKIGISIVPFDISGGSEVLDEAVTGALDAAPESGIDVLILNAGQYYCSPAIDSAAAVANLMQVNFAGNVHLALKLMQRDRWMAKQRGHIVTISSLVGRGSAPLNAVYSASKHALRAYFLSLAAEEKSWLRVDMVLPGPVNTDLWNSSWKRENDNTRHILHADDRSKMPVKRCAQLIISSMIGPSYLFFETWISPNPGLLWVYLASYEPLTFHFLTTYIIAPFRISMWRKNGEDSFSFTSILHYTLERFFDKIMGQSKSLPPTISSHVSEI